MKKLLTIILAICSVTFVRAQADFVPKFDGTKYYMVIYDGAGNEKVLSYKSTAGWNEAVSYSNYFDGSNSQLWVFETPDQQPGYINVRNLDESLTSKHFLKSWSWNAYLEPQSGGREGDQEKDLELIFRFKHVFEGWQALETIEKPSGLYGVEYTPGGDALNVNSKGVASFVGVKTTSLTKANAAMKVFKLVEFNPMALFIGAIERGQQLYDTKPKISAAARGDLFYVLEKARETRVFGTEAQMLAFQKTIDAATVKFMSFSELDQSVADAKVFINGAGAEETVKASFNAVVTNLEKFLTGTSVDYTKVDGLKADLAAAKSLVTAIVEAKTYHSTLTGVDDPKVASGMVVAIDKAKAVLADTKSVATDFNNSVSYLAKMKELIIEILSAKALIANTKDFDDAKQVLTADINKIVTIANTSATTLTELTAAVKSTQNAIVTFKRALEAGDTVVTLKNAGFEDNLKDWDINSDNAGIPYIEKKGVDGSKSISIWKGADYHVMVSQSLKGLPNGRYQITVMATVSETDVISFFAVSGSNSVEKKLAFEEWTHTKRTIVVEVADGTLQFGVKGSGTDNLVSSGRWGVFDNFEIRWLSLIAVNNPGFENDLAGWTSDSDSPGIPYIQKDGVEKSKNLAVWKGSDYHVSTFQTLNVPNGKYKVSVWAKISAADKISLFAESGTSKAVTVFPEGGSAYAKTALEVSVTDGTLKFGFKGAGADNLIPANVWGTFDNWEVVRIPDVPLVNPNFESDFLGWVKNSDTDWMPYIEKKGVEGSKSVTFWQGVVHHVALSQALSGIANGTYDVSAMTLASNDNSYLLFGQSGGKENSTSLLVSSALAKNKVTATVSDGTLSFGIRGSGEGNMVPAGHWIVFDNFEVKLKTITPEYVQVKSGQTSNMVTGLSPIKDEVTMKWWQTDNLIHVDATEVISSMTVYSITGSKIIDIHPNSTQVSFPSSKGIYLLRVKSGKNTESVQKIVVK
ncbi:MAG: T9SS type A sorting domain-containing protein [Prolixibacteraceae bacterium]|nr:T9SS type A sorting domain-containing protein [Prolixibacteraceae bacterium]